MQITSEMIAWILVLYFWIAGGRIIVSAAPFLVRHDKEKRGALQNPTIRIILIIIWPFIWFFC